MPRACGTGSREALILLGRLIGAAIAPEGCQMSNFIIIRYPRGRYVRFRQYFDPNPWCGASPLERRESVEMRRAHSQQRAALAMGRSAERRGRTSSSAYAAARAIAYQECFEVPTMAGSKSTLVSHSNHRRKAVFYLFYETAVPH